MTDRHCGNCRYFGELLKDDLHSCNNEKSIIRGCLETATGCREHEMMAESEPQKSEDKE